MSHSKIKQYQQLQKDLMEANNTEAMDNYIWPQINLS